MSKPRTYKVPSRGDTIVEVLMAILVVSLVIAGAFSSARYSLSGTRESQERNEAVKIAQGHVEYLAHLAGEENDEIFKASTGLFCIKESDVSIVKFGVDTLPALDSDDYSIYPEECKNLSNRYNISIKFNDATNIFTATIRWVEFGASRNQEAFIRYRLHSGELGPAP